MSVDVHAHFWTDAYLDKIAALGKTDTAAQRGRGAGDGAELEARLALMDRAGVGMQILSASPQLPHGPDETAAVDAARYVNDQYAGLVARHPGRFRARSRPCRCRTWTPRRPSSRVPWTSWAWPVSR
jgi:6-methylsalicylate decarboxylase